MVYCAALEMRLGRKSLVGSNPTPSAPNQNIVWFGAAPHRSALADLVRGALNLMK